MPLGGFRLNTLARYEAPTGPDYVVPTAAFTSDANTKTLLKFENNATDTSGTYTYTSTNGSYNTTTKQFGSYSWFSASSASLVRYVRSSTNVTSPTAWNNTIEGWVYTTSYTDQEYGYGSGVPKGLGWTAGTDWGLSLGISNSGYLRVFWFQGGYQAITSTATVPLNQWNHIVFQFDKNTNAVKLGLNGYWVATGSITGAVGDNLFTVGTVRLNSPNNYWDEVRYSNAMRYASRSANSITVYGNAQVDTAQSKFGGASALFDGTDDWLDVINPNSNWNFGTSSDFTIEGWFRPQSTSSGRVMYSLYDGSTFRASFYHDGGQVYFYSAGTGAVATGDFPSINTWSHWAITRSSGTTKIWYNGTETASTSSSWTATFTRWILGGENPSGSTIANDYIGHMDEMRISNTARYTANFTPSTTAFTNDSDTRLLLHFNGTDASTIFQDDNA